MNELDALLKIGRKVAAGFILIGEAVGFAGFFVLAVAAVVVLLFCLVLTGGPTKPAAPPAEDWVEFSNRLERENNQTAIRACLQAGGVPIFGSVQGRGWYRVAGVSE